MLVTHHCKAYKSKMLLSPFHFVWDHGSLVMLDKLSNYLCCHRSGLKRDELRTLQEYVIKRVDMTDYPTFRQLGYDCGS